MKCRRPAWAVILLLPLLSLACCPVSRAPANKPVMLNPEISLKPDSASRPFQFVIMADRTGGERPGVFNEGLDKVNLLQPDFVMNVGDLIEGYIDRPNRKPFAEQVRELTTMTSKLQMPMFYTVGNHDISNMAQGQLWRQRYGQPYYHFTYRKVLFLVMCTQDPEAKIGPEQADYFANALRQNPDVRWTFVFMHNPLWTAPKDRLIPNGWGKIEPLLKDRPYTVFAGHTHHYALAQRNGQKYFILATTGGDSSLAGPKAGQFDHLVWVTMTDHGPVLANLMLDGIYGENVAAGQPNRTPATRPATQKTAAPSPASRATTRTAAP